MGAQGVAVGDDGSDQIFVDDYDGFYTTTLNVADATVRVAGTPADGTTITLFDADNIVGTDTLTLLFNDAAQWDLTNIAAGRITFGTAPGVTGDINGDGSVTFPDFLILSAKFGRAGGRAEGDLNGDGQISFPDFLVLSANFGATAAAAASVPEPSGLALFGIAALAFGLLRRCR